MALKPAQIAVVAALVLAGGAFVLYRFVIAPTTDVPAEVRPSHVKDTTPRHGDAVPGSPMNVVLDLDLDAVDGTNISITAHGEEFGSQQTIIDENGLAVRRALRPDVLDGEYVVAYTVCTTDGVCEDGNFHFTVDRSLAADFVDLRGNATVDIAMEDIAFAPADILIDQGTIVRWTNSEPLEHFINTDSHPYHTYYVPHNSRGLTEGGTFEVTFDQPGWYPYHCSTHADVMRGAIIVQ